MSRFYEHEKREKKKYPGPRPSLPEADYELFPLQRQYLFSRNLDFCLAEANGWYPVYLWGKRIVIPCSNSAGVPYWQARDITGKSTIRYTSPLASRDDSIAIVWPPTISNAKYQSSVKGSVVVEGPMDALAAAGCGYVGIGLMGNEPNDEVLHYMLSIIKDFEPVLIIPDIDHVEMIGTVAGFLAQCGVMSKGLLPHKKDLAEMTLKERRSFLNG